MIKKFISNGERGQAMMVATMFFLVVALTIIYGLAGPVLKQEKTVSNLFLSRQSYFLAEAGIEDAIYRLSSGKPVPASNTLTLNGSTVTITTTTNATGKQIVANSSVQNDVRKVQTDLALGTGISFHYGIQSGQGGFTLANSSSVVGNVYSGGPITGSGNFIYGDAVSSGPSGQIYGIHATGSAYAHNLGNAAAGTIVDKNAYYQVKTNTTVGGSLFPGSADLGSVDLPITDAQISDWETDAAGGGSVTCSSGTYTINSNVTIGPKKIPCDLKIAGTGGGITVDVTGPLWATGNITITNTVLIKMDSSLGSQNVAIIADNPSDPNGSGLISIGQNTTFQGSGAVGSFVFMISQNKSAENGGVTQAITMNNGASALVAYAIHGLINLAQSVGVKEVTAYQISLSNSAKVTYDRGLPSVLFEAGPSGGYSILDWKEIQ